MFRLHVYHPHVVCVLLSGFVTIRSEPHQSRDMTDYHQAVSNLKTLNDRTEAEKQTARDRDAKTHDELNSMRAMRENERCADCDERHPGWAALPHGVFLW